MTALEECWGPPPRNPHSFHHGSQHWLGPQPEAAQPGRSDGKGTSASPQPQAHQRFPSLRQLCGFHRPGRWPLSTAPGHLVTRAHEASGVGSSLIAGHPGGSGGESAMSCMRSSRERSGCERRSGSPSKSRALMVPFGQKISLGQT